MSKPMIDGTDPNNDASYADADGDLVPDYVETNLDEHRSQRRR